MSDDRIGTEASVQIQTVLYRHGLDVLRRWLSGIAASVRQGAQGAGIGPFVVAIGDCSSPRVLTDADISSLQHEAERLGLEAQVHYQVFDENLGSAGGHNRLFGDLIDYELYWVVNPDTVVAPGCLRELARAMREPGVGLAEARQVPLEHVKWYDPLTGDTSWASGACVLIRREALRQTGGFDAATFPLYGDDVDLSWRARLKGWRVRYVPTAVVFHDKCLDSTGVPVPTAAEPGWEARIALLLPWKYGREDLAQARAMEWINCSWEPFRRAAEAYFRAQDAGELPDPIENAAAVADFNDYLYGPVRFTYPHPIVELRDTDT